METCGACVHVYLGHRNRLPVSRLELYIVQETPKQLKSRKRSCYRGTCLSRSWGFKIDSETGGEVGFWGFGVDSFTEKDGEIGVMPAGEPDVNRPYTCHLELSIHEQ